MKDTFRRDLFWLCWRHVNKPETDVGAAATRLLTHPTPTAGQWRADLQLVLDATWRLNRFGFYTSSLRAQGAALRMQERMKEIA
jgi:hypothetical protein